MIESLVIMFLLLVNRKKQTFSVEYWISVESAHFIGVGVMLDLD